MPHKQFSPVAAVGIWKDTNPYMAKVTGPMTNSRAVKVLAEIEQKLMGYEKGNKAPLPANRQVQLLLGQATDLRNLCQGKLSS